MTTLGIDLGGTKIMAVRVDGETVADRAKRSTPRTGGPADVLDAMAAAAVAADPEGNAGAIGVGVPGPVRPGTGVLPHASNLPGWTADIDVAGELSARLGGRPVVVDNDVNVATLAEHRLGAGRGTDDLLGVFMGTGVGAGLVLGGRLRQGPRGLAGEIGHLFVSFRDMVAGGIVRGELEDYAGRRAMEARARRIHADGEPTALVELAGEGRMRSRVWSEAVALGDPVAQRLVDEAAEAMSAALASAIALVDVEMIVLGGGMAQRLGERFRADVQRRLADRAFVGLSAPIRTASLGDTGGALGAALLVGELVR